MEERSKRIMPRVILTVGLVMTLAPRDSFAKDYKIQQARITNLYAVKREDSRNCPTLDATTAYVRDLVGEMCRNEPIKHPGHPEMDNYPAPKELCNDYRRCVGE